VNRELKPKKILLLSNSFDYGGKEKIMIDLAERFPLFRIQPVVIILSRLIGRISSFPEVLMFTPRFSGDWAPAIKILRIIKQNSIHSVICFDVFSYFNARLAVLFLWSKPQIILSLHNSDFSERKKEMLHAWLWRFIGAKKDKITAICNYQADYYSKKFYINRSRFNIIYNGIDVDYYAGKSSKSRETICIQHQLPASKRYIIQVGGLRIEKKHEDSLLALSILRETYGCNDTALLIIGSGTPEREKILRDYAHILCLDDFVYFLGMQADVRDFLSIASLFTLSSVAVETFSIAALEAMASGLPCVITKVGGAAEMIVEGMNGFTVAPHNPAELAKGWYKVLQTRNSFFSENISNYVREHFSIERCAALYAELIHNDK
jgi:glycosyltransferase involved in cell wall biosynthesis